MEFGTGSHKIAQAGLELIIFLLPTSEHQDYMCAQLPLAVGIFFSFGVLYL